MPGSGTDGRSPRQISQPRVAEMVADVLRARIVNGALADGDLLPKQDDLLDEFRVSRPSIREAMRILETEGLISVRRGNIGGAQVHAPKEKSAAYMLGLVMQSRHVELSDLAAALRLLEPACAALCAEREDRHEAVVPRLRSLNERAEAAIEDDATLTRLMLEFHDALVELCGVTTMKLLVGALESLWSHHEWQWAKTVQAEGDYPAMGLRRATIKTHSRLTDAIEAGNADRAHRIAREHFDRTQRNVLESGDPSAHINITGSGRGSLSRPHFERPRIA